MDLEFNKNDDKMRLLISQMEQRLNKIYEGGGKKRIEKLHEQGKMSARERIDFLLDKDKPRFEMGAFAGYGMYEEHGGCPSGGVVVKIGYIKGKQCVVVANDATVKAGAWFPISAKKNLIAQEIEKVLPEVVFTDTEKEKYKSVSYGNIVAILIEGIKAQQVIIDSQAAEIASLKATVAAILQKYPV